ncbi:MAG: dipeptidyl-peptidase [Acidobacteriota bacterium]|nr:dipeptidyl-peptidase [Acidobacteriota bacterium]
MNDEYDRVAIFIAHHSSFIISLWHTYYNPGQHTKEFDGGSALKSTARTLLSFLLLVGIIFSCSTHAQTHAQARAGRKPERTSLVERVGSTGILQLEAESFRGLSPRQKILAYYLSQASIAVDPIIYDQMSRFGLRQKRILEAVVSHPRGVRPATLKKINDYTKLFWANTGNHNGYTAQKFLPEFTYTELEQAGLQAVKNGELLLTPDEFRKELSELRPAFFDPKFEPMSTAKSPEGGLDIIQASANNFYGPNVTLADLKNFQERYPLNARVVKTADGTLVEQVYRAGTPDGTVPPGLYAEYLNKAIGFLQKARPYAEPGQADVIDKLIRFYQTGEYRDWIAVGEAWVQNRVTVDFSNGFVEVYRDARGVKGAIQGFVTITDEALNHIMTRIADNAQYFEDRAPWKDEYKKQGVKAPVAMAVEPVAENGDFGISTVGDNLPNENEIHEKYGTKNFFFTGSTRAFARATGTTALEEFASSPEEIRLVKAHGEEAENLLTALHEVIGHGSGKLNPRLTHEPQFYLKEYYSTLEEARADLMALWNISDPKLRELGLVSSPEVMKAMYYSAARVMLTQLRSTTEGDQIEEDHQRDRQLIAAYIMDKTGAIRVVERGGKHYVEVTDFDKMREGVGMLLAELMRIKAEGDYDAIKALIDKYGVHFDPKLRDEVVARYKKLGLPTYFAGINPDLTPTTGADGKVTSVRISYPRDFMRQRLAYSAMYEPTLLAAGKRWMPPPPRPRPR